MKTVIEMARESGFAIDVSTDPNSPPSWWGAGHDDRFKAFAELVRADEREQCAKVCDDLLVPVHISLDNESLWEAATLDCADAIRARGQALDKKAENARELGLDYEPVCNKDPQGCWNVRCQLGKKCKNTPAQRTWVGLTDEAIWLEYQRFWPFHPAEEPTLAKDIAKFANAIEAKLKEKNNG